jgi:hypothetical protein
MSLAAVETALETLAETALGDVPTEWENAKVDKDNAAKWAKVVFVSNQPTAATMGTGGRDHVDGFLQIDLNYRQGKGKAQAKNDFEAIRGYFKAGDHPVNSGQVVTVRNCGRSQGRIVDNWYRVSITVTWYAQIPR